MCVCMYDIHTPHMRARTRAHTHTHTQIFLADITKFYKILNFLIVLRFTIHVFIFENMFPNKTR